MGHYGRIEIRQLQVADHCHCQVEPVSKLTHCHFQVEPLSTLSHVKGALYGIEPSTHNGKIWPTREEAAPSVPKNILLNLNPTRTRASLFQSITDVSTTALSRITFKSHELKIATTVITRHACSCQLSQFYPPLGCATSSTSTRYF